MQNTNFGLWLSDIYSHVQFYGTVYVCVYIYVSRGYFIRELTSDFHFIMYLRF